MPRESAATCDSLELTSSWCPQVAYAHVRGGGECGRGWHEAGRQLRKPSSVQDLLDCAQACIGWGLTSPGLIAVRGISAGEATQKCMPCPGLDHTSEINFAGPEVARRETR